MDVGSWSIAYLAAVHMHLERVVLKKNRRGRRESSANFVHWLFTLLGSLHLAVAFQVRNLESWLFNPQMFPSEESETSNLKAVNSK